MSQPPNTFGDLLSRLAPLPRATVRCWGPLIATALPRNGRSTPENKPLWVILHSISDWSVRLIHAQPLGDLQVDVEIKVADGEMLRFTLSLDRSQKIGELYETSAEVVRSGWSALPYSTAP